MALLAGKFSTLVELLRWRSLQQPEENVYTFLNNREVGELNLTYGQLDYQARSIAALLQSCVTSQEPVLLLFQPGLDFIAAFLGCLYAGVIAVPAYPPKPNRSIHRLQTIVADTQLKVVLTTVSLLSNVERWVNQCPDMKTLRWLTVDDIPNNLAEKWQKPTISKNTLTFLQYTSGSTGTPKGVMVSHNNLLHNSECIKQSFELSSSSVSVCWLPNFHDMGLIDGIIQPLYTGFLGVLMSPMFFLERPIRWLQTISDYRATHSGGPNFAYDLCVRKVTPEHMKFLDLSSWCTAYTGSEPVRRETLEQFTQIFNPCGFHSRFLYPCYGLAEATLMVSGGLVKDEPIFCTVDADKLEQNQIVEASEDKQRVVKLVGCGRSVLDTSIVIVHPESLTLCLPNEIGEIWVSSQSVAQGYWNKPEYSQRIFEAYLADSDIGPFLRTGDLGFLKDGELFITGRLKDLIIIWGRNYYPQDIELTVEQSHPALRPSCSAAFSVEVKGEERLVVAQEVERNYLRNLDFNQVIRNMRQAVIEQHDLQIYAVALLKTGSIPKTSSGKIQRQACRTAYLGGTLNLWDAKEV